jgi:hypothetical protein
MGRYRKVDPRIWNDLKFRSLSDDGKLAFLLLLTHPQMTALGAMRGTVPGLAAEIGWRAERAAKAFREVFREGMAKHDEKASFLWLPRFLRYNKPESPNVVKAWASGLDLLPECPLFFELLQEVKGYLKGLPKAFGEALPEAFAKAMPYQEQEQEQEQKKTKPFPSTEAVEVGGAYYLTKKKRRLEGKRLSSFEVFWAAFDHKHGKAEAADAWLEIPELTEALLKRILAAARTEAERRPELQARGKTAIYPQGWLSGRRWEDEAYFESGGSNGTGSNPDAKRTERIFEHAEEAKKRAAPMPDALKALFSRGNPGPEPEADEEERRRILREQARQMTGGRG